MRCQFCGWENPDSKTVCEKCHQPLVQGGASIAKSTVREDKKNPSSDSRIAQEESVGEKINFKTTVREKSPSSATVNTLEMCPNCGYKLDGDEVCPCCGAEVGKSSNSDNSMNFKKTVRPQHENRFVHEEPVPAGFNLVKLSNSCEALNTIKFDKDNVVLNRDNTDAGNMTITSQSQAVIKKENGQWLIVDQSELRSTFVQASRPVVLKDGDIILLGDQLFKFETH